MQGMGNWRTVNITGTMAAGHAAKLRDLLDDRDNIGTAGDVWDQAYACLSFSSTRPGLCGFGAWPAERVNAAGNLAERNFSVEDVAEALRALVQHAPTMLLKVHCGGEYESDECIATISVGEGLVVVGKPEVEKIVPPPEGQMLGNLLTNMLR